MGFQSAEVIIQVPLENFFDVLVDFECYPEFVGSVKTTEILKKEGNESQVYFELDLIQTVKYTLRMVENKPNSLRWSLVDGDLFKVMTGILRWNTRVGLYWYLITDEYPPFSMD